MIVAPIVRFRGEYNWLSNFWPGEGFTAEHLFQSGKAVLDRDRIAILRTPNAGAAKRLGRKVLMRLEWEAEWDYMVDDQKLRYYLDGVDFGPMLYKDWWMLKVLREKFSPGGGLFGRWDLTTKLLDTAPAWLEEGNNRGDQYWGTVEGKGWNKLGKLLMVIRRELNEPATLIHIHGRRS